jgi:hypothetical protein
MFLVAWKRAMIDSTAEVHQEETGVELQQENRDLE